MPAPASQPRPHARRPPAHSHSPSRASDAPHTLAEKKKQDNNDTTALGSQHPSNPITQRSRITGACVRALTYVPGAQRSASPSPPKPYPRTHHPIGEQGHPHRDGAKRGGRHQITRFYAFGRRGNRNRTSSGGGHNFQRSPTGSNKSRERRGKAEQKRGCTLVVEALFVSAHRACIFFFRLDFLRWKGIGEQEREEGYKISDGLQRAGRLRGGHGQTDADGGATRASAVVSGAPVPPRPSASADGGARTPAAPQARTIRKKRTKKTPALYGAAM